MLIELVGFPKKCPRTDGRWLNTMETIWLQRPGGDVPWGFRLQGGREFAQPIAVQRVTPGSVAENGLEPGDTVLKIGSVNATNISLNEAQDVIKGATNLLQLTIKKGNVAPPPLSPQAMTAAQYPQEPPEPRYNSSYDQGQQQGQGYAFPDYRVGSAYQDQFPSENSSGQNPYAPGSSPYEQAPPSGYSTLPARSGQNSESYRQVQDPQNKYPYKTTAGIQLQINPQTPPRDVQRVQDDADIYNQQRSSPAQYQAAQDSQYQRQTSGGSNRSDTNSSQPQSHFKKPTPFSPAYNGNTEMPTPPQLQRQTSSGSQNSTAYKATVSKPSYAPNSHSPGSDGAPPPPPPPVNYTPEPYQRQSSQQGAYNSSPYDRQNSYDQYQQRPPPPQQPGVYVDTADHSAPQYQRQGSRPQDFGAPPPQQYQSQQSQPSYYNGQPSQPPAPPPPAGYQRQPSYGSQPQTPSYGSAPPTPQQQPSYGSAPQTPQQQPYGTPYTPQQSYNRQPSREQTQPSYPVSPPGGGSGINSFEDILQPFEKFQNSNYCDKLFSRDNRVDNDSGVMSDFSQSFSSDTPRSTQSNYSSYSPPQPGYPQPGYSQPGYPQPGYPQPGYGGQQQTAPPPPPPMNLLQPATAGAPPPPISPPPPPPPPPPSDWQPTPRRIPQVGGKPVTGGQEQMPDKVLNTMLKNQGTQKPFSYVPTGMDLKKFKERAKQRQQQQRVMPRAYVGPPVEDDDVTDSNKSIGAVPTPDTGVYKHAQYNSPLKMYSSDTAREQFDIQSGGHTEVTPGGGTPERRASDIKDSEVYRMCKEADSKGKNGHVTPDLENEAVQSREQSGGKSVDQSGEPDVQFVAPPPASRGQGLSFRVLQWLTDTADDTDPDDNVESYKPKKPRNPLLRHNSEDDEMRFSGLHTKADIPSKAFSRLNKLVISDDGQPAGNPEGKEQEEEEPTSRIGNYDEASIRYRGKYIPSPSFRLLQSMAKEEERNLKLAPPAPVRSNPPAPNANNAAPAGPSDEDEDDGLPDKLSEEDMVDKRYTGANIPSKSFKALQMFTDSGDEGKKPAGGTGGPKIKVINRAAMSPGTTSDSGTATPPNRTATPTDSNPISDF